MLGPVKRDRTFFATALEQEEERGQEWSDTPQGAVEAINRALLRPEFESARSSSGPKAQPPTVRRRTPGRLKAGD